MGMEADGTFDVLPKKEVIGLRLEMEKLTKYLGGIKDMKKLPGALFIVAVSYTHLDVYKRQMQSKGIGGWIAVDNIPSWRVYKMVGNKAPRPPLPRMAAAT